MSNPVGFASVTTISGAGDVSVPGLIQVMPPPGAPTTGGASELQGSDPSYGGTSDAFYTCFGDPDHPHLTGTSFAWDYTTTVPQDLAAFLVAAGIEYCDLTINWGSTGAGAFLAGCPPEDSAGEISPTSVSMAGFGPLDLGVGYDSAPPELPAPPVLARNTLAADSVLGVNEGILPAAWPTTGGGAFTLPPFSNLLVQGLLLRPMPLAWAGQDPDNAANRAIWRPSEIAAITYSGTAFGSEFSINPTWIMAARQPIAIPGTCTITPLPTPPVLVSTIQAGQHTVGVIRLGGPS